MKNSKTRASGPSPRGRRKAVSTSQKDWVSLHPLLKDRAIPMVVEPKVEGLKLAEWTASNKDYVESLLWEHRALLFRGFDSGGIAGFEAFVEAASSSDRLEYKDRSTPRNDFGDRIYNATTYPADQTINLHNEGTYWTKWARKIFFGCITNAETGGETPIGDVHKVYQRIDPAIREEFERRQVLYVRNFNHGFGLDWQEVYQSEDPAQVEAYCRENAIDFEWFEGGRLRTRQVRPAVRKHPVSGEPVWFNHAAFFNVEAHDPAMRDTLLNELGEQDLPYNTFYGDGGSIPPEVVHHILEAYAAERVTFRWQEGDVALYDNTRIAHGREPYTGERLTVVAMTEPCSGSEQ